MVHLVAPTFSSNPGKAAIERLQSKLSGIKRGAIEPNLDTNKGRMETVIAYADLYLEVLKATQECMTELAEITRKAGQ